MLARSSTFDFLKVLLRDDGTRLELYLLALSFIGLQDVVLELRREVKDCSRVDANVAE